MCVCVRRWVLAEDSRCQSHSSDLCQSCDSAPEVVSNSAPWSRHAESRSTWLVSSGWGIQTQTHSLNTLFIVKINIINQQCRHGELLNIELNSLKGNPQGVPTHMLIFFRESESKDFKEDLHNSFNIMMVHVDHVYQNRPKLTICI